MKVTISTKIAAREKIREFLDEFKFQLAYEIQRNAVKNLNQPRKPFGRPTSVTGKLARSIEVKKTQDGYIVEATAPYAEAVEYGARPHWVPIKPLLEWAKSKLGDESIAYAVQVSISKKGMMAHPYMEPAISQSIGPALKRAIRKVFGTG